MSDDKHNIDGYVSLSQAVEFIAHNPEVRVHLEGNPGMGKSSATPLISKRASEIHDVEYVDAYFDSATADTGDVVYPLVDRDNKTYEWIANSLFRLREGKRVVINIDELTKAFTSVVNAIHPLFEQNNPRLGIEKLPKGSIVFSTGNLTSDGVGDKMQAHTRNRLVKLRIRNHTNEEWLHNYAVPNELHPILCAWVHRKPELFEMHTQYKDSDRAENGGKLPNPYIFDPKMQGGQGCVTPRSLSFCSPILKSYERKVIDYHTCRQALVGTIGEVGGRDLISFVDAHATLPHLEHIIAKPLEAPMPTDLGAMCLLSWELQAKLDKDNAVSLMQYVGRMTPEWQSVVRFALVKHPTKMNIVTRIKEFTHWFAENHDLVASV